MRAALASLVLACATSAAEARPARTPAPAATRPAVPAGFTIEVLADGLGKPGMLAVAQDGTVYVARRAPGDVWMLADRDGDGRAEVKARVVARPGLYGVALDGDEVFLATTQQILAARRTPDGSLGALTTIADGLPAKGAHDDRTIAVGPDGKLYVAIGSTCDACPQAEPYRASIVQLDRTGGLPRVFASGLRNTVGLGWHPVTGEMWGMDHGIAALGDASRDELDHLEDGQRYGWPYVHADGTYNLAGPPPAEGGYAGWAAQARPPALLHAGRSAPMQLVFYANTEFPAAYHDGAFVALRGEVAFIRFDDRGQPVTIDPFVTGLGRPWGVAVAPDGSLLVGDGDRGVVYRVRYRAP